MFVKDNLQDFLGNKEKSRFIWGCEEVAIKFLLIVCLM